MSQRFDRNVSTAKILPAIGAALISLSLWTAPSLAKDPFRTTNARPISDRTEAAFRAFFEQGNYPLAAKYLQQMDPNEPMAYALKASLLYSDLQGEKDPQKKADQLEQIRSYATQTINSAQAMAGKDPMRGNLYLAVGNFLNAGYSLLKDGTVKGMPEGMRSVQTAFDYLDKAQSLGPNDPEVNLIKGYVQLLLALNVPFSSPTEAIDRLNKYAAPRYLADRGIALGYRDLNQPTKALDAVNRALKEAPDNPELQYLKAQILVKQKNYKDSIPLFQKALEKQSQLPPSLVLQIARELSRSQRNLTTSGQ
jgi:tetratricopeptide (TPR) repeat protein